jgi:hypothetical protein
MKLYHGTTSKHLDKILERGIEPRGQRRSNWPDAPSGQDRVYLSTAYAPYFAIQATRKPHYPIVIEIDTTKLNMLNLVADEDYLEQISRKWDTLRYDGITTMEERTKYYREHALEVGIHDERMTVWESLKRLGNAAHIGTIPTAAISRIVKIDYKKAPGISSVFLDPFISLWNYGIVGKKYRWYTGLLFGDPNPEDAPEEHPLPPDFDPEIKKAWGWTDKRVEFPRDFPENERQGISLVYSAG